MNIEWSNWTEWIQAPLRIILVIGIGLLVRLVIVRLIDGLVLRASGLRPPQRILGSSRLAGLVKNGNTAYSERRRQRAEALGSLFKSVVTLVLGAIVIFMALAELGYDLAPIIASAGIVGVALGFGAQNLVKDFLSGSFMLIEDQYGIGDFIDMGEAVGTVEGVGLRITKLRDFQGVAWYVRNGEVLRVGNRSQGWSQLLIDINVAPDSDIDRVRELINATSEQLANDPDWSALIVERPVMMGVEDVNGLAMTIRLVGKCASNEHWGVQRELRRRLKDVFDREGINLPMPMAPWSTTPTR